uniref:Uncharacterized protein n=1 Tax=viral metagenome TaxID=1070528 RepID=A0A6C0BLC9_9ZZZZ
MIPFRSIIIISCIVSIIGGIETVVTYPMDVCHHLHRRITRGRVVDASEDEIYCSVDDIINRLQGDDEE